VIPFDLYAVAGVLLLAAFGGYIGWRNGRKARHADACAHFRSDILKELQGLFPIPTQWPSDGVAIDPIVRRAFPTLRRAVAEFRPYVPLWRWRAFDRAWFEYRCSTGREV